LTPVVARAQACCAGASAVTPGRLALHETALVGVQSRAAWLLGSYDSTATYRAPPPATGEWDFEQDVVASLRVLRRGQASLLLPFVESRRWTPTTGPEFGGGVGDLNASARYDFSWAREYARAPGVALLLGVTLPTGRAPESARLPLASDATGVGALQVNAGVALERAFSHWLVGVSGLFAERLPRHVRGVESELGPQWTALASTAYVFANEASLAGAVTFTSEGQASIDAKAVAGTAKRLLRVALAGSVTATDSLRLQASIYLDPPLDALGKNEPATTGVIFTLLWSSL
jgi:hypothetical protein